MPIANSSASERLSPFDTADSSLVRLDSFSLQTPSLPATISIPSSRSYLSVDTRVANAGHRINFPAKLRCRSQYLKRRTWKSTEAEGGSLRLDFDRTPVANLTRCKVERNGTKDSASFGSKKSTDMSMQWKFLDFRVAKITVYLFNGSL